MNQDRYLFSASDNYLNFEFESDGPNGKIKKVVSYWPINFRGTIFFNLSFGHPNEKTKSLDDKAVSNNQDRDKILAPVAATVLDITDHFPGIHVFAKGSNPARTRLYQMSISANLKEIENNFIVNGWCHGQWQSFKKNVIYKAFSVHRKKKN